MDLSALAGIGTGRNIRILNSHSCLLLFFYLGLTELSATAYGGLQSAEFQGKKNMGTNRG